ncbi:hypothetical protein [Streptomyces sp. VRA16 Mangrove soil]|uniref:hypothetical protein n=1 Tax=Streptomyces sp. VRA16 Mangrove soil TaxID=2817434 RepID=UPI001A9F6CB2|nr:hypothetical protein [Streptomyces sp. VRA16 Mangrove soil]MBO1334284.1 hypothetical protein [Streptomyces sp. VRA16 Mangrove soil]
MRLRRPIALGIAATAAALAPAGPLAAAADSGLPQGVTAQAGPRAAGGAMDRSAAGAATARREPSCDAAADGDDFPVRARIRKGPTAYHPGGGYRDWSIDLTNTADVSCGNIHPVLVLADPRRTLRPRQIQLEFLDGARWRPVPFERTDEGENIGVFDDGFPGVAVGSGDTVTVRVRLAFTSDTPPGRVVADAALVQRRGDDGDWVGESDDYAFAIVADGESPSFADELAKTGPGASALGLGAVAGALLLAGGALVAGSRRLRLKGR